MLLTRFLLVLRARWRLALGVALLVTGLVALVTALLPRAYTASAAVVLDVKSPDPVAGLVLPGMGYSSYMATQAEILQSERVATKAAELLSPAQHASFQTLWQEKTQGSGDYQAWLADHLLALVEARPGRESNVLTVWSTTTDPQLSADIANAFVQGFINTTLELKVEPARLYSSFFDEQAKGLRERLEAARSRLTAYQRSSGITVTDERIDVENAKLNELSSQFVALQGAVSDTGSRVAQARRSPDRMQEVLNNPVITGLKADLGRQQARLDEMLARLGEQHPQVRELRASINRVNSRINDETARLVGGIRASDSVNRSRIEQTRTALEAQRDRVLRLREQRNHLAGLTKDVDNSQSAYDAMFTRRSQSTVESQLTQTNVSILKHAMPPQQPARPRVLLNLALGAAIGALLGLAVIVFREGLRPVLRTEDDVLHGLGVELLERLPALPVARPLLSRGMRLPEWPTLGRPDART